MQLTIYTKKMTTLLETCRIPPPTAGDLLLLPLTFFDMIWLQSDPVRRLLFYQDEDPNNNNNNCWSSSEAYFLETLVPKLKQSLSLTLQHYPPLAGHLLIPSDPDHTKPLIRYAPGDSVPLTVAQSTRDFDDLVGNHARDADQFYEFVPQLPPTEEEGAEYKTILAPLMAIQVTLFPGRGICIGFANHHTLGDARSMVGFLHAWASITKLGRSDHVLPPIFDKSVINDPHGIDAIFWKAKREIPFKPSSSFPLPTNRVRATFTLHQAHIKKLKDFIISANKPGLADVSSFVATTSYVWTCFLKSGDEVGEEKVQVHDNVLEFFFFAVDVRGRTDPPVPANYFGNCLSHGMAFTEHKQLVGEESYAITAAAIAETIKNKVNNKEEVLKGAENWVANAQKYKGLLRTFSVSGSPKFDLSNADFGWGRTRKVEVLSIDGDKYSMSLCKSNDSQGGLEIGLSLPKARMEAFAAIFAHGLR